MRNHFLLALWSKRTGRGVRFQRLYSTGRAAGGAALAFLAAESLAAASPTSGLWAGEVTLTRVNETVVGINAQNQTVAPDPAVTTPVKSPAHLRILLHVDGQGQVRLLKSVAVVDKSTNNTPDLALITDHALYPNFASIGKRFTAVAFDFGDGNAADLLNQIAVAAGAAAPTNGAASATAAIVAKADVEAIYQSFVTGTGFRFATMNAALAAKLGAMQAQGTNGNAAQVLSAATGAVAGNLYVVTNLAYAQTLQAAALFPDSRFVAAVAAVSSAAAGAAAEAASSNLTAVVVGAQATNAALAALTNAIHAPAIVSPGYQTFLTTASFQSAAGLAATAATTTANQAIADGALPALVRNRAQAAALKALTDASVFKTADKIVNEKLPLTGQLTAGGTLTGNIYLGANHPRNPFLHRRHTDHTTGFEITRALRIQFAAATGTNTAAVVGFGVDRLTGEYREEVFGLHKPLGPNQTIGLITEGVISLDRISTVDTLNQ